jgi:hypothetical protein
MNVFSWVRRRALKSAIRGQSSILLKQGPGEPSLIVVTALAAFFVAVGAVTYTRANAEHGPANSALLPAYSQPVSVDGAPFPSSGDFDEKYLTNGKHTVVWSAYGTTAQTIDVNNDLGPLQALRNSMFFWLHGNRTAVNTAEAVLAIIVGAALVLAGLKGWHLPGRGR